MPDMEMKQQAAELLDVCKSKGVKIVTAESCTGGMIAALLTDVPGSSAVFERGFVTYSNESKTQMLGVDANLIAAHGAVSEQVAGAMAAGAISHSKARLAVAVTGIAGPDGGTAEKPVGLVFIATALGDAVNVRKFLFKGDRAAVREQSVTEALLMLKEALSSYGSLA